MKSSVTETQRQRHRDQILKLEADKPGLSLKRYPAQLFIY